MGSRVRRACTVTGGAVNVASRLEGRTKYYGIGIPAGKGTRWDKALRAWRARQWEPVEANLHQLQRMDPECGLYRVYAGRVAGSRRNPPPEAWDGATAFDEK